MTKNDVTFQRDEYANALPDWLRVDDVVSGERAVKAKGDKYLPRPNPDDAVKENTARYEQYVSRAVFYNTTGRTLQSLVGAAFRKVPTLDAKSGIEYVATDIDGNGLSIYQQSQETLREVLKRGRHGLLVDYPQVDGSRISRADMATGHIRSTVASIGAKQVVNWRVAKFGAQYKLSLLVISEMVEEVTPDGFGVDSIEQYRVLRLNGAYTQELWRKNEKNEWLVYQDEYTVLDGAGRPWDVIPFTFVGSNNNDPTVDPSPLLDLANLNIAHYRNSADYEEGVFMHGQGTMVVSIGEMNADDFKTANPTGLKLGSRGGFVVGNGGSADLLQMDANSAAKEAMDQKETQMVALGARLITPGSAVKTATEAQGEQEAEHSVLSLAVSNVSEAYVLCLGWMARFMGVDGDSLYEINQEFTKLNLDAQMLTALVQLWNSGKYPEGDLWTQLRKYGLIDPEKDDEAIKDEIDSQGNGLGLE